MTYLFSYKKSFRLAVMPLVFFNLLLNSCDAPNQVTITGSVDYIGDAEFYIKKPALHYKYSPESRIPLSVDNQQFNGSFVTDSAQIIWIYLQDVGYPLFTEPGNHYELQIRRAQFPFGVKITGPNTRLNQSYQQFLRETQGLERTLTEEMNKFRAGYQNQLLALSAKKVSLAKKFLSGSPLNDLYLKAIGEDLVIKLRTIEYTQRLDPSFDADMARRKVVEEAKQKNFFSLESLQAQRAGIRDFTHYWSRTFGIYDSVQTDYGQPLAEYDIKHMAYEQLNKKRMQVLGFIETRKAKAYAELFLVAERIGEQPVEIYEPSYHAYLEKYSEYREYTEFLTYFYNEIKSVSPGQPAVAFSLPDSEGEIHTMTEYQGSFVLLDFWAGWCQPCLGEFPHMRKIYRDYSRDELEILGISTETDSLVWIQDITRFKNPWPQLYGGNGFNQETFKAYKGGGIPFYILIDPDGKIARYNDIRPSFNFTEVLDSLLKDYKTKTASL